MKLIQTLAATMFVLPAAFSAHAATSESFMSEIQIQRQNGLSRQNVAKVTRVEDGSASKRLALFEKTLGIDAADAVSLTKKNGEVKLEKPDKWLMTIDPSGTSGFYQNMEADFQKGFIPAKNVEPSETLIRRFDNSVKEQLKQIFVLDSDEELVTVQIRADVYSSTHSDKRIEGYSLTYYRKKAGTFIIGGGSYLKVGVTVDGEIVSVRFDWPKYTLESTREKAAGIEDIVRRAHQIKEKLKIETTKEMEIKICGMWDDPKPKESKIGLECIYGNDDVLLKVPAGETFDVQNVDSKRVLYKADKLQEAAHE